jgi:hypothetical protein
MSDFVFLFRASHAEQEQAMGSPESVQKSMEAWLAWIRGLEAKGYLGSGVVMQRYAVAR